MPYIVPSSTSTSTVTPPHSPTRPPLALSIALASPAPVPALTPFIPPDLPASPKPASILASVHQSIGSAAFGVASQGSVHPPLIKALSDSRAPTVTTTTSPSGTRSDPTSRSPPIRRAVSASSASPTPGLYQHSNTAGTSLPHVPRRRTGSACTDVEYEATAISQSTPPRGRSRSRFVVGSEEEESGSGNEERRKGVAIMNGHAEMPEEMEERVIHANTSDSEASDCVTPTQSRIAQGVRKFVPQHEVVEKADNAHRKTNGLTAFPGIAPRARRGRGKEGVRRRSTFGSDSEDEESKLGTSTISFPTSGPPSPPPDIAVNTPTPEMTPCTSPKPDSKSFAGKRANAGSLRLDFSFGAGSGEPNGSASKRDRHLLEHGRTLSESASLNSMPLIRKKSGEIVKPSLKTRSSSTSSARQRPSFSLGDISSLAIGSPSLSAPATPSTPAKMVHFDSQLEHIKVFRATSRPVAVSRDGSPTYDDTTSGGEGDSASEGPSLADFIPRPRPRRLVPGGTAGEEEEAVRRILMMRILNMPKRDPSNDDADVRLEGLHLADDAASVQGIVRVRNIAFEKTVAIRFTFDGWQTTSEVLARWSESCIPRNTMGSSIPRNRAVSTPVSGLKTGKPPAPTFDRFTFSIRLSDLLLRIDEKTLVLAIRYCSAGREMWDNNDGQNYRAVFERRLQHTLTLSGPAVVPPGPDHFKERNRGGDSGNRPGGGAGASPSNGTTTNGGKADASTFGAYFSSDKLSMSTISKLKDEKPLSPAKKSSDLSSRYDIDSSLKNSSTWKPTFDQPHTWGGPGTRNDAKLSRPNMPWPWSAPNGQPSEKFVAEFFKTRPFESHNVAFGLRDIVRGSPRDLDRESLDDSAIERYSRVPRATSREASTPMGTPLSRFVSPPSWSRPGQEPHVRNHHRSSYFDAWASSGYSTTSFGSGKARLTPPGTPGSFAVSLLSGPDVDPLPLDSTPRPPSSSSDGQSCSLPERPESFRPLLHAGKGSLSTGLGLMTGHPLANRLRNLDRTASDSEVSTPSIASVSSPATTTSPSSPAELPAAAPLVQLNWATPNSATMDNNGYMAFVNSFCFYQGRLETPGQDMRRAHSASEIQELLSTPPPSPCETYPMFKGPAPASSCSTSCTATPTASPGSLSPDALPEPPTSAGLLEAEVGQSTRVRC